VKDSTIDRRRIYGRNGRNRCDALAIDAYLAGQMHSP
jgi:hypothetical protein